jgi:hypothetical protein
MPRKLKDNWIVAYAKGYGPFSEAPEQFMLWSAISALGSVLKNKVYFKYGTYTVYPNQYVILTSEPGIGKGESMFPIQTMMEELGLANIIHDRVTAPKIIDRLASGFAGSIAPVNGQINIKKDYSATLVATELANLLSSSDWMLTFLCDLWDKGRFFYDTKNQGTSNVTSGLCVSLLGACVPNYIQHFNKDKMASVNGGFTARALFIFADEVSKRIPIPKDISASPQGQELNRKLKEDLITISSLRGPMSFDFEAEREYIKFYNSLTRILDDDSDIVRHFKRRMKVHVIKLGIIFSVASKDTLIIDKFDIMNAVKCVRDIMVNLDKVFSGFGESDLAEATWRVRSFVDKKGLTTYKEILTNLHRHVNQENLSRILQIMYTIGACKEKVSGGRQLIESTKMAKQTIITNASSISGGLVP